MNFLIQNFSHFHISTFAYFHICIFSHLHIFTFPHSLHLKQNLPGIIPALKVSTGDPDSVSR